MGSVSSQVQEQRKQIAEATESIRSRAKVEPRVGIVCGTGMGALAERIEDAVRIPYDEIPHFPISTVESHHGNLVLGTLSGQPVYVMQGRFHYYEGYTMKQVTFPVRVMRSLGCEAMVVMNAVGSMNPSIGRGSLVFISDMINMFGDNPLLGPNDDELGPRFPDMSAPFSRKMIEVAEDVALRAGIRTHRGVLVGVPGPNLETRAEYRAFRMWGADIVGMSTVPEVLVANQGGMKVIGISTVTDECLPDALKPADIREIIAVAQAAEPKLDIIVSGLLKRLEEAI
ncbi:purine-nucleoside phosphorylase [Candidatus Sumerlaeota bacterium]|nr:purine-nucleoside phosphorylase [Candidatus Sumerlaeota bacterium]